MLKNSDFRYKLSIGEKFKNVLKTIATIGLTASLMLGATFGISACGKKTPSAEIDPPKQDTPIEPDDPTKPDLPENPDQPENPEQPENPDQPTNPDPDQPVDPDDPSKPEDKGPDEEPQKPVEPTFELNAKTKAKIEENLADIINEMCIDSGSFSYKNPDLQEAYLRKSETGIVDTIGCVMYINNGSGLLYSEMQITKINHDLSWEELYKEKPNFKTNDLIAFPTKRLFKATNSASVMQDYDIQYRDDVFKKAFNITDDEYSSALFTGWTYQASILRAEHTLTLIKDNTIYVTSINLEQKGASLFEDFVNMFINGTSEYIQEKQTPTQLIPTEYLDYVVDFTEKETAAENQ